MHQPGYIQEGQGVIFGYLLLGIYYRRIPGETWGYGPFVGFGSAKFGKRFLDSHTP
jgi:hypothetical protein